MATLEKNRSEWNLAIGNALTPPTIIEIDPSRYCGQAEERIVIGNGGALVGVQL
jgi:hypothetical protein